MFFDSEFICAELKGFIYEFCPFQVLVLIISNWETALR